MPREDFREQTLAAGLLSGNCMLPMKFAKRWPWENTWLIFTVMSHCGASEQIVRCVAAGTKLEGVVAVTFTHAAAGEMKLRLREELGKAGNHRPTLNLPLSAQFTRSRGLPEPAAGGSEIVFERASGAARYSYRTSAAQGADVAPLQREIRQRLGREDRAQKQKDYSSHGQAWKFFAISPADRNVSATNVSVPFVHPAVGCVGAPTTNRFS